MAYTQDSCTLSTITDVQAIYTYFLLVPSTTTVVPGMMPQDASGSNPGNPPGADTITITYMGTPYYWTKTEPGINIQTNDIGTLYYMQCTSFSDSTFDWGPLMTSSSYQASIQAFNKATAGMILAQGINQYFWWITEDSGLAMPAGVYVTEIGQEDFMSSPEGNNIFMSTEEGIVLRDGLDVRAIYGPDGIQLKGYDDNNNQTIGVNLSTNGFIVKQDNKTDIFNIDFSVDEPILNPVENLYDTDKVLTSSKTYDITGLHLEEGDTFGITFEGGIIYQCIYDYAVWTSGVSSFPNQKERRFPRGTCTLTGSLIKQNCFTYGTSYTRSYVLGSRVSAGQHYPTSTVSAESELTYSVFYDGENTITVFKTIVTGSTFNDYFSIAESSFRLVSISYNQNIFAPSIVFGTTRYSSTPSGFSSGFGQELWFAPDNPNEFVIGRFNLESDTKNAFTIGNGTGEAYSNALTVDWDGNLSISGSITDGSGNVLSNKVQGSMGSSTTSAADYNPITYWTDNKVISSGNAFLHGNGSLILEGNATRVGTVTRFKTNQSLTLTSGTRSTTSFTLPKGAWVVVSNVTMIGPGGTTGGYLQLASGISTSFSSGDYTQVYRHTSANTAIERTDVRRVTDDTTYYVGVQTNVGSGDALKATVNVYGVRIV